MEEIEKKTAEFLAALTELSLKTGIAVSGSSPLFLMEIEDRGRNYQIDADGNLSFV
jgi:hypothetical protein